MSMKTQNIRTLFYQNKQLFLLLMIGGLYFIGTFLSSTFVNVYLWKQSNDYAVIALYNLGIFVFQPITFIISGQLAKKIDRIIILRIGIIFLSFFYILVLSIRELSATYPFLLGSLLGIGYGFYWLSFNVLTFEITEPETRDLFSGLIGTLQSLGGMIGPLVAGTIISMLVSNIGYTVIFAISFLLFIIAIIISFLLQKRTSKGNFSIQKVVKEKMHNLNWGRVLHAHFFQGLREGIFLFVITIWVFIVVKDEFYLGLFHLILSGFSFLMYIVMTKYIQSHTRRISIFVGAFLMYIAIFIFLLQKTFLSAIIYAILVGIATPILFVPYTSMTYDVIGTSANAQRWRIEYIVVREFYVNIGRICSVIIFLFTAMIYPIEQAIPSLLMIFGAGYFLIYYYMRNVHLRFS